MAIYPCQFGGHRYAGRQSSAYLTEVDGAHPSSYKARLCPADAKAVAVLVDSWLTPVADALNSSLVCEKCDGAATRHVYVTLYAGQEEGASYAGDFCASHAQRCLDALRYAEWAPR